MVSQLCSIADLTVSFQASKDFFSRQTLLGVVPIAMLSGDEIIAVLAQGRRDYIP